MTKIMLIDKNKDLSQYTEEEINETIEKFISKFENCFDEFRPWFGSDPYFKLFEKDFNAIRELCKNI